MRYTVLIHLFFKDVHDVKTLYHEIQCVLTLYRKIPCVFGNALGYTIPNVKCIVKLDINFSKELWYNFVSRNIMRYNFVSQNTMRFWKCIGIYDRKHKTHCKT